MEPLLSDLKALIIRHKNTNNSEVSKLINKIESIPYDEDEFLDFNSDDEDAYEEISSDNEDQTHDPTISKYSFEKMSEICELIGKGTTYKQIRHLYKKLKNDEEIVRQVTQIAFKPNKHF